MATTAVPIALLALLLLPAQDPEQPPVDSKDLTLGKDKKKRYFFIGPQKDAKVPKDGYKLAIVLPGGDGSAEFHPFVRRVWREALGPEYLLVQPVPVKWNPNQVIVWPTKENPVPGMKYATEEFVEALVAEVSKAHKVNPRHVFTLSWSSGGPAAYSISLKVKEVTGSFISQSVFRDADLPPLKNAKGRAYYLHHSPEDKTCPIDLAKKARDELAKQGAKVEYAEYEGGHGWHGDVYGQLRAGFQWLEKATAR
jgi:predicted esterase